MASNVNNREAATEEYKWTERDTEALILWRTANEALFTGRRNAAQNAFEEFVKDQGLVGKVDATKIKRTWENLKQKYMELKAPRTGVSTEGGEATAASWKWYTLMDEALGWRPSITPPVMVDSLFQNVVVASTSSNPCPGPLSRKEKEPDWLKILKEEKEYDEIRERQALEREEKWERERMDREDKRERERLDREDKRERERLEREEKRDQQWQDWLGQLLRK